MMIAKGVGLIVLLFLVTPGLASDVSVKSDDRVSRSLEYFANDPPAEQNFQSTPRQTRPSLVVAGYRAEFSSGSPAAVRMRAFHENCQCIDPHITLFDANLLLNGDFDRDGYFSIFELGFDADTDQAVTRIYAEISLSLEGGPWNPVFTTADIVLRGNDASDEYIVETALDNGYPSGFYDLLIQFFSSRDHTLLASYGPADSHLLRTLPLEDAQRDDNRIDDYAIYGGGGLGGLLVFALMGLMRFRHSV